MREMLEAFEDWFYEVPADRIIPVLLKIALGLLHGHVHRFVRVVKIL